MPVVLKCERRLFQDSAAFDVNRAVSIHQNIAYGVIFEKRFQRPKAKDFIDNFLRKPVSLGRTSRDSLLVDHPLDDIEELLLRAARLLYLCKFVEIDAFDELFMNSRFDVLLHTIADRPHGPPWALIGSNRIGRTSICV